jgi:alkylation response protein AidB-like acyl-CoA dehydrogenase
VPLGIARHAIDEFVAVADGKMPLLSTSPVADKAVAQDRLGRAVATVEAARHYLVDTLGELWTKVVDGHGPTMADRGALWLAATHAAQTSLAAIDMLYTTAGASSVHEICALDRCLRDARTAAQHIVTQEVNYETAGRARFGRPLGPSLWVLDFRGEA